MALNDFPDFIKERYKLIRLIGKGEFGTVYVAEEKSSFTELSLKIIETNDSQVLRNAKLLLRINHPNLIRLYDSTYRDLKLCLAMEYVRGGSLRDRLKKYNGKLTVTISKLYFYQMCKAVNFLHWNGIIHGNIRPENMLFADDRELTIIKLSDYGLNFNYRNICLNSKNKTYLKNYIAPEIFNSQERDFSSTKIDIWSLGVVLYECLKGRPPSASITDSQKTKWNLGIRTWNHIPDTAKSTIEAMLEVSPNRRLNIEEVLLCFWLDDTEMKNVVLKLSEKYSKRH